MPLIGTTGHVDHGKSTLVQTLTGRDPDRWEEEKRRGLTIDLGFAWMNLGGVEASFVDVPGHERYLKNMLAGIEAIDLALFVVAADEGWMPQSEEHLAVLDLLEVSRGVVAVTKTDLVDEELVELVALETAEKLKGTSLEGAVVIPVSATTGAGIEVLVDSLATLVGEIGPSDRARPRLWVDRSFSASGAGTVVTGSLLDGELAVDDAVAIYPRGREARVRGIQSHEEPTERASPGRRVALNLARLDRSEIARGDMVGLPAQWDISQRILVSLKSARYVDDLKPRGAYQLHLGSSSHGVTIVGLGVEEAVLQTDTPLPVAVGDRFILRDTGRKLVVAGGRVLDPSPGPTREALTVPPPDPDSSPDRIAADLLRLRGSDLAWRLAAHSGGGTPDTALQVGDRLFDPSRFDALRSETEEAAADYHRRHPLREGMPLATLAEKLGLDLEGAAVVVENSDRLERRGPEVAMKDWNVELSLDQEEQWQKVRVRLEADLAVPTVAELGLDPELVHLLIRRGRLIRISDALVYLPDQIGQIRGVLSEMPPEFTVADFRDAIGLSRKYAVPILEWADREGLTVRRGDTRSAR
ncbi:MAG: selenocysteine-specific translation elongation factor [Acidimicrobiia bacterium]